MRSESEQISSGPLPERSTLYLLTHVIESELSPGAIAPRLDPPLEADDLEALKPLLDAIREAGGRLFFPDPNV